MVDDNKGRSDVRAQSDDPEIYRSYFFTDRYSLITHGCMCMPIGTIGGAC